jgi:hypothetical protein
MNDINSEDLRPMTAEIANSVGDYDHALVESQVQNIIDPKKSPQLVAMTAAQAAHIYIHHNDHNRDISPRKALEYKRAMERGEWMDNHQGMAFYDGGNLADGQHRCAAIALSGKVQNVLIYIGFKKEAIQTIDLGKGRTAGEALKMEGVTDGLIKASVIKLAREYHHLIEHGVRPTYTQIQVVASVKDNNAPLDNCVEKADFLLRTVADTPMKRADVALHLFIMTQYGNFRMDHAADFIGSVLTGVAPYEGAPQLVLSRVLTRAKHGAKSADKLNGVARIATIQKAAKLWSEQQKCSKLTWSKKEGFPLASAPGEDADATEADEAA